MISNIPLLVLRMALPAAATIVLFLAGGAGLLRAAAEDEDADEAVPRRAVFAPENFDQWVFGGGQNAAAGRTNIESRLSLQIQEIDGCCHLTKSQREKLELAARGDIKRFFDRVEVSRKKFLAVRNDQNRINEVWQDIQPLQQQLRAGLFAEESLFHKTLGKTLGEDQAANYKTLQRARRLFRYKACIYTVLMKLETAVPFRDEQRESFVKLLLEETAPPEQFGQFDYYFVMYQLAGLPNQKRNSVLDEVQRKMLRRELAQARAMEQTLVHNKVIATSGRGTPDWLRTVKALIPSRPALQEEKQAGNE